MRRLLFISIFIPAITFSQRSIELHITNISKAVAPSELRYMKDKAFYNIELNLKNDSHYLPIMFWRMSCVWAEQFIFPQNNFYIIYRCISNGPVRSLILPQTVIKFRGILCTPAATTLNEINNMQVGFIFYDGQTLSRDRYISICHYESREQIQKEYGDSFQIIWNSPPGYNLSMSKAWHLSSHLQSIVLPP